MADKLWSCARSTTLHALAGQPAKREALEASRQTRLRHALLEIIAKPVALQASWQTYLVHALVEFIAKHEGQPAESPFRNCG